MVGRMERPKGLATARPDGSLTLSRTHWPPRYQGRGIHHTNFVHHSEDSGDKAQACTRQACVAGGELTGWLCVIVGIASASASTSPDWLGEELSVIDRSQI